MKKNFYRSKKFFLNIKILYITCRLYYKKTQVVWVILFVSNYEKMLFNQKIAWFFHSLFFKNWILKRFPVSNQPGTFSIGGINVWNLRTHGSKFDFRPWYFQNSALTAKFLKIHSWFFQSKTMNFRRKHQEWKSS